MVDIKFENIIENNIKFEAIDDIDITDLVYKLGPIYAPTFDDKPIFFVKTKHAYNQVDIVDGEVVTVSGTKYDIFLFKVMKCSNSWFGIVDGKFANDYRDYIVTDICKINFD